MQKTPAVLLDDPRWQDGYDLRRALSGWKDGLLAVITPVEAPVSGVAPGAAAAGAAAAGGDGKPAAGDATPAAGSVTFGKSDSTTTRGLKTAPMRYTIAGKGITSREFVAAEGPEVLHGLGVSPLVLVCAVSYATYPLVVELASHEHTRGFLRVGVTGVRMDTVYNLARKLIVDGHIAYHEHTRILDKVLCPRLEVMLHAHAERRRAGAS
jgi:hypothetical protein